MAKKKWKKVRDKHGKGGKITGVILVNSDTGEVKTLLNPHGKYVKACAELRDNKRYTNDGMTKKKNGKVQRLSKTQRCFRAGYRTAVIDQTKAYKAGGGR